MLPRGRTPLLGFTKICDVPGGFADGCICRHRVRLRQPYRFGSGFRRRRVTSEHHIVLISVLITITVALVYDISCYLQHNLQHRVPVLWELHKVYHLAGMMVGTTKDRTHPIGDVMNQVWDRLITGPIQHPGRFLHLTLSRSPFWASMSMYSEVSS